MKLRTPGGRLYGVLLVLILLATGLEAKAYTVPKLNTLYHFTGEDFPTIGNFELSTLIQASDGDFYGVSAYGGTGYGFVFKVSRTTGAMTHLHDFGFSDGATPRGALIQATDGYLYGTTEAGGTNRSDYCYLGQYYQESGCGTLFRISLSGQFTKLHDFYSSADGYQNAPSTGVVLGSDGNLYGMAIRSFPSGTTSMFKATTAGVVSVHYLFDIEGRDGYQAWGGLIVGSDGAFYGTTGSSGELGGVPGAGCGTAFRIDLAGSFSRLHTFAGPGATNDGCKPWATLLQAQDGNLYGTTKFGGLEQGNCIAGGCGIVFRLGTDGSYTVLHRFTGTDGSGEYPQGAGLTQMPDGTLYGVTGGNPYGEGFGYVPLCQIGSGTTWSCGTLFTITPGGTLTQIFDFGESNSAYGLFPHSSLILADDGNLYANTIGGGGWGAGVLYRWVLDPATPILAIDGLSTDGGKPGDSVLINGEGFTGTSRVTFGNGEALVDAAFTVLSDQQIGATVPPDAAASAPGVTSPRGTNYSPQTYWIVPVIDDITPDTARVGQGITLIGDHFDAIQSIVFTGGAVATDWYYINSTNEAIGFSVPRGAKSGPITVTNPGGSAVSPPLTVRGGRRGLMPEVAMPLSPNPQVVRCEALPPRDGGSHAMNRACGPATALHH